MKRIKGDFYALQERVTALAGGLKGLTSAFTAFGELVEQNSDEQVEASLMASVSTSVTLTLNNTLSLDLWAFNNIISLN
jgi:hypothetical protein